MSEYGLCESCGYSDATHGVVFVKTPDQRESIEFKACQLCAEYVEMRSGARIRPLQEAPDAADESDPAVPEVPDQDPPTLSK